MNQLLQSSQKRARIFMLMVFTLSSYWSVAQIKGHFDPSQKKHKHTLTFKKHVATTGFTDADATAMLTYATQILQSCDNATNDEQDVACAVSFERSGSVGAFGSVGDGLDVINTEAELSAVLNDASAFIKVVTSIESVCGLPPGSGAFGCARTPGSTMVIRAGDPVNIIGETFAHEFGHTRGLNHRPSPNVANPVNDKAIMHASNVGVNEVNQVEAAAYHSGATAVDDGPNRPVDVVFVVDDTGSMGEEIEGVKQGIIQYLNTFTTAPNSCSAKVFQLTTFKDTPNTTRAPTSDLNVIRNQVSALFASGGGDCPEASIEAMIAVDALVKDGGEVRLYTDADAHPGQNRQAVVNLYNARGVKLSTLLSGNCGGSSALVATTSGATSSKNAAFSDNKDGSSEPKSTEAISEKSAIDDYSFISQQTGGAFVYFPEVNSGNPADFQRYVDLVFNLLVGSVSSAVTLIEPFNGPVGSTLTLTITGTNTNFNATSSVVFSGTGITVGTPTALSATKIEVPITIAASASLGSRNVTIMTTLVGGGTETANGVGLFAVTAAPTTPTIVGITPTSGSTGQTLTVTVSGLNTTFTNSSVLNMGAGITILSSSALSGSQLQAQIKIADDAVAGFRNVTVTTGSEVATENVTGPFLVTTAGCAPISIASVTIPSGGTASLTASGCAGTLLWSTGGSTSTIMVGPLIESTIVSATCTTESCVVSATATITVSPTTGGALTLLAPTYDCTTGAFTFNTSGGDGSPVSFSAIGITGPTTNPNQFVDQALRTAADAPLITLAATQSGVTVSYVWNIRAVCPVGPVTPGGPLTLTAPTYNCATGAFTFNTSGGDGTPVSFSAIGITGPTTNPNQFVDQALRTAPDAPLITLSATQSGITVTYVWNIRTVCPLTPGGGALTLVSPTYNCATGAFTFNATGGDGSTIEYRAVPGITDWTTNPNQFVDEGSRTANDVQPFLLQARQNGVVVTLIWDLKAACGRARSGTLEPTAGLKVSVLGNPVAGQTVEVDVSGVEHQPLRVQLSNLQGQLVSEQQVKQAAAVERVRLSLNRSAGIYLLQVSSPGQTKVVRILKVN